MVVLVPFLNSRLIKGVFGTWMSVSRLGKLFKHKLTVLVPGRGNTGMCGYGRSGQEFKNQDSGRGAYIGRQASYCRRFSLAVSSPFSLSDAGLGEVAQSCGTEGPEADSNRVTLKTKVTTPRMNGLLGLESNRQLRSSRRNSPLFSAKEYFTYERNVSNFESSYHC